ncbi:hypothetical protein BDN72DRAFT_960734 [Pluteus cervinus]|uniref:Uncharacterized protein n=1 Tax=Pluteus cervinus TaxID=181527 RepID=A0ACD3APG7_9AGAR|nr:hypothetical protein BDN72DRAFT_960734 [Pluteus cervinus]
MDRLWTTPNVSALKEVYLKYYDNLNGILTSTAYLDIAPSTSENLKVNSLANRHIHLRMHFLFIQAFLFSCTKARQDPSDDINTLETVTFETGHPPMWKVDGEPWRSRKPIKTLVLEHSDPLVEFAAFAERIVIAGTESHRQLHVEFPVQFPKHPFESFGSSDLD